MCLRPTCLLFVVLGYLQVLSCSICSMLAYDVILFVAQSISRIDETSMKMLEDVVNDSKVASNGEMLHGHPSILPLHSNIRKQYGAQANRQEVQIIIKQELTHHIRCTRSNKVLKQLQFAFRMCLT